MLPYTVVSPGCSVISNIVASRTKAPLIFLLLAGVMYHLVGIVLLSTEKSIVFRSSILGYEAIAGAGVGITFLIVVLGTPFVVKPRDIGKPIHNSLPTIKLIYFLAVATGAIVRMRFLGGVVGVATTSSYMNSHMNSALRSVLDQPTLHELMQDIRNIQRLPSDLKIHVKQVLAHGYATQNRILIGFMVAQVLVLALVWRKNQLKSM